MIVPWLPSFLVFVVSLTLSSICEGESRVWSMRERQTQPWQKRQVAAVTHTPTSAPVIVEYWPTDPIPSDPPSLNPSSSFGVDPKFIVATTQKPVTAAPIATPSSSKSSTTAPETILHSTTTADTTSGATVSLVPMFSMSAVAWSLWMMIGF
jgi:hypothetical protein